MTTGTVIICLLIAIILLLCEKREDRPRAIGGIALFAIIGTSLYYVWPFLWSLVLLAVSTLVARVGWLWTVLIAINTPFVLYGLGYLVWAAWEDAKEKRDKGRLKASI